MGESGSCDTPEPARAGLTRRRLLARAGQGAALFGGAQLWPWLEPALAAGAKRGPAPVWSFGGELQYFRSEPAHLADRLKRCADAGYNTIQTYVAWNVHENVRGTIDFTGQTHPLIVNDHVDQYEIETPDDQFSHGGAQQQVVANTDLAGYLRQLTDGGFRVILRPGPFISDEWRNGGIPDWLLEAGYPDMYMRGPDGTPLTPGAPFSEPLVGGVAGGGPLFYFPSPSYASQFYLDEVRSWLISFAEFVRPWLVTNGGPVVAVQVDDESCFYYRFGPFEADYHPAMTARFRAATGQDPPTAYPAPGGSPAALRPAFEWQRFKSDQIATFLGTLGGYLRGAGVGVPIHHEEELQLSPPAGLAQIGGQVDQLNPEFYNGDTGPWSLPLNELDAAAALAAQRHRRRVLGAEMDNGDLLLYTLLFGEGISGGLQFTYTDGVTDDSFDEMARLGRTIKAAGPRLAVTKRRADAAVVWCPNQLYAPYRSDRYGFERDVRRVAERDIPALATMLVRAGLSFDLLDTDVAQPGDYRAYRTIWLVASDVLPRAAQEALVRFVERGGRLICWPAPPTLDERLEPCTVLADAVFPERRGAFLDGDDQEIVALGVKVRAFRGVQTFALSSSARPIATAAGAVCGYRRRHGRGEGWLLGTWPAADSVPGRAGVVFDVEQVSSGSGSAASQARALAQRRFGDRAAAAIGDDIQQPGTGSPQYTLVYEYSNERRGGEVITGGTIAYWDGNDVVPVAEINTADQPVDGTPQPYGAAVVTPPYRPLTAAHLKLARKLLGHARAVRTSDSRAQVRVLDAPAQKAATVAALNRFPDDIATVLELDVNGRRVRLPEHGALKLPARSHLLMPIDYKLGHGVRIVQAAAQLTGYRVAARAADLELYSPAGGELIAAVPGRLTRVTVAGRSAPFVAHRMRGGGTRARVELPPGDQEARLEWEPAQPSRRRRRRRRRPRFTG